MSRCRILSKRYSGGSQTALEPCASIAVFIRHLHPAAALMSLLKMLSFADSETSARLASLRLSEPQCHPVTLSNGFIPGTIFIAQTERRWQGPHASWMILGIARVGVDL